MLKSILLKKSAIFFAILFLFFISLSLAAFPAVAYTTNTGGSDNTLFGGWAAQLQTELGLGNEDPRSIIANLINITLGFLGIISIIIIMYAGFLWMTSNGNPDKINKAKHTLISGLIGLIIILSAFAIAAFVLDLIYRATYGGSGSSGSGNHLPTTPVPPPPGPPGPLGPDYQLPCSSDPDTCTPDDNACDVLGPDDIWACNDSCICVAQNLGSCYNITDNICDLPCSLGTSCLGYNAAGLCQNNHASQGCGVNNDSCQCCCSPATDTCNQIYPTLKCRPDVHPCDGPERGLCCGCKADSECGIGSVATIGCGDDTCCNQRPTVVDVPLDGEANVCTNARITVEFSQPMKLANVRDNFLVVGEYNVPCPASTRLASPASIGLPAVAGINYCIVDGGYSSRKEKIGVLDHHYIDFSTSDFLRVNTRYHIIVVGDEVIDNNIDEGILNYWGISMDGTESAYEFTTINDTSGAGGACVIDRVELTPAAYLIHVAEDSIRENDIDRGDPSFDTNDDNDKLLVAEAISRNNQTIVPVGGYTWNWDIDNNASTVVTLNSAISGLSPYGNEFLVNAIEGVTDGRALITARIEMPATNVSMVGNGAFDTSNVYVFICNNPWPPVDLAATPSWQPWHPTPNPYNYDIYYCRDRGSSVTVDDLPAFDSSGVDYDGDHSDPVMQQVYFTYQIPPSPSPLNTAESAPPSALYPDGGVVRLTWTGATSLYGTIGGYKVYWGESNGIYTKSQDVGMVTSADISGLENGRTYYFSVTVYTLEKAESSHSNELSAVPLDKFAPPSFPTFISAETVPGRTQLELHWSEDPAADSYEFAYGLQAGPPYGVQDNVEQDLGVKINGLSPGTTYYFGIRSVDASGNGGPWNTYHTSTLP